MKIKMKTGITLLFIVLMGMVQAQPPSGIHWSKDGNGFFAVEDGSIVLTGLPAFSKKIIVSKSKLIPAGSSTALSVRNFFFSPDNNQVLIYTNTKRVWRYDTKGDYWLLDIASGQLRQLGKGRPVSSLMFAKFSPDGKKVAYVSEYNIYVEDLKTGLITAVTKNGNRKLIYGTFDWVYEEEFGCRDGFRWSPDSKHIAYWQINGAATKDYLMMNTTDSIYSYVIPVEYPSAGEHPSPYKIGVINIDTRQNKWMSVPNDPVYQSYVPRMEWAGHKQLIVQHMNRKQNETALLLCDIVSGKSTSIYQEKEQAWISTIGEWDNDYDYGGWDWLNNGKEFLWASEKDGWRHLYRISLDGKKETLIIKGNYDVMDLHAIDEKTGYVYFAASPDNATQKYLYRTKLDGSGVAERLTPANQPGTHNYVVSPTGAFAQHSFSNYYTPNTREWVSLAGHQPIDGNKVDGALAKADKTKSNIEFFKVNTIDGIEMDGWMVKPKNFDPNKKYPVVFFVYTEPAGANVKDQYGAGNNRLYVGNMAEDGYIYITVDNRGTPVPKGKEWRKSIYRKVGLINIRDQAMAAKEIFKWSYIDTSRVAVWGWSGGGSATLNLMFQYPDIYKTGIAIAAVANQLTYDNIYQERYMGLPQENKADFMAGSPITYAKNLKGNLLYIHGTGDDNVHYNNAEMLVNELVAQGKQFQFMAYPNRSHGISEGKGTAQHLSKLYTNFLKQHCPPGGR